MHQLQALAAHQRYLQQRTWLHWLRQTSKPKAHLVSAVRAPDQL
jgi:hypothetical protein